MRRVAGVAGLVFVLVTVVPALIVHAPPAAGASPAEIAAYYSAGNRGGQLFANWLGAAGIAPSFVFFAGILAVVRAAEGERAWLWLVALLGLAGAFPAVIALTALAEVLSFSAAAIGVDIARVLVDLSGLTLVVYLFPMTAFFVPVGVVATTRGGLPRWLGYGAYLAAAVSALATLGLFWSPLTPGGVVTLAAFGLHVVWWLAASVALLLPAGR